MLEEKQTRVLDAIWEFCKEPDVFKILDADDILSALPAGTKMTKDELSSAIKELKDRELVKVKYFTVNEYCLSASPRAFFVQEKRQDEVKIEEALKSEPIITNAKSVKKRVKSLSSFWGAFFGALLGGAIIMIIFAVLQKFVF